MNRNWSEYLIPTIALSIGLFLWEGIVRVFEVPVYILPAPTEIITTLVKDWPTLSWSFLVTLEITAAALVLSVLGSIILAVLLTQSKFLERALYPFLVAVQVTPIVAISPLLIIYAPTTGTAVLICAFIVAFFPLLANTMMGLTSTDHNLLDLFEMNRASSLQQFFLLRAPSALPYFLAGLRISGGLALTAAIVAEFAAGTAGKGSGLAFRIIESQFRLNIPRLFAALFLIMATGILIYLALSAVSFALLRNWHDSARGRET